MRNYLLAARPRLRRRDAGRGARRSGYVGIEGGVLFPKSQNVYGTIDFTNAANTDFARPRRQRQVQDRL